MKRRTHEIVSIIVVSALASGCSGFSRLDFTSWGRAIWQRPDDVVEALSIPSGARVADIGAGDGYFVPYLANAVGSEGRVHAVEVDPELVEAMESRFAGEENVEVVTGGFDDPRLPDGTIDLVLVVNAYHHIDSRQAYFRRLREDLAADGRVALVEADPERGGILGLFVPSGHGTAPSELVREMEAAGYRHLESIDLLPIQNVEVFGLRQTCMRAQSHATTGLVAFRCL